MKKKVEMLYGIQVVVSHEMPRGRALIYGDPSPEGVYKMAVLDLVTGEMLKFPGAVEAIENVTQVVVNTRGKRRLIERMAQIGSKL